MNSVTYPSNMYLLEARVGSQPEARVGFQPPRSPQHGNPPNTYLAEGLLECHPIRRMRENKQHLQLAFEFDRLKYARGSRRIRRVPDPLV
jgi:hypothetical protein